MKKKTTRVVINGIRLFMLPPFTISISNKLCCIIRQRPLAEQMTNKRCIRKNVPAPSEILNMDIRLYK